MPGSKRTLSLKVRQAVRHRSWKTTIAGVAGILGVLLTGLSELWDGNPNTNPDWALICGIIASQIGLLFARDNDKSSEDVGAVKDDVIASIAPVSDRAG